MIRNVSRQAAALAQARQRRVALDQARDQQDRRVEQATAAALVALDEQAEAQRALQAAAAAAGSALASLVTESGSVERAASLVDLDAVVTRRLLKAAGGTGAADTGAGGTGGRGAVGGGGDAGRAG